MVLMLLKLFLSLEKEEKPIRLFDETRFQKALMTSGHINVNSTREIILFLDSLGRYYRATIDFHPNSKVTVNNYNKKYLDGFRKSVK